MFFRKSRKLRFDARRAPHPQIGHSAADLGMEWLEERQLLTAVASTGEFADPSCSDPTNGSGQTLRVTGHDVALNAGGSTINSAPTGAAGADASVVGSAGSAAPAISAPPPQTSTLSGYVFSEATSGLGDFDPDDPGTGEDPLAGVTVTLFDNTTESSQTVVTGLDGSYSFSNLVAGNYTIGVTTPPGATSDSPFVGNQESGIGQGGEITGIQLAAGTDGTKNDFPEIVQPATLSGTAFIEPSLGSPDYDPSNPAAGELPLAGATVELSTTDGTEIGTTTTNANGTYSFTNLAPNLPLFVQNPTTAPGSPAVQPQVVNTDGYVLTVLPPDGYAADTAIAGKQSTATAGSGSLSGIELGPDTAENGDDFPLLITVPGILSGYAFSEPEPGSADYNPSDPSGGETPLVGVTVDLEDSLGNTISSTVTGLNGAYAFAGLGPGTYSIVEPNADFDEGNDTAFVGTLGGSASVGAITDIDVVPDEIGTGYDLPEFVTPSSLSGYVFAEQTPGSPAYDPTNPAAGETPLDDVTVTLTNSAGNFVAAIQTNSAGAYTFANLEPDVSDDDEEESDGIANFAISEAGDSDSLVRGTYNLSVGAPLGYESDNAIVGSQGNGTAGLGSLAGISLDGGTVGTDNDFVELPTSTGFKITESDNLGGSSATAATGTAVPGQAITYSIAVTNDGPRSVTGASIVDNLPSALSGAIFTATETGGASGFSPGGSGSIDDEVDMPVGSTITYTVQAGISSAANGTLSNTATVTPPLGVTDTETGTATDSDTLTPETDLEITAADNLGGSSVGDAVGAAVPGGGVTYTVVVTNAGPSDASGAKVVDALPSSLTGATYTAVATGGATGFTPSGSGSIDDADVDLPVGSTVTYTVQGTISPTASGTLSNTATVATPGGSTDPNTENNTATDADALTGTPQGDLRISLVDNAGGSSLAGTAGNVLAGNSITYTIVATNAGPDELGGVSVQDTIPSTLTGATYTATATGGATGFTVGGAGSIDDTELDMPAGSTITYTVHATVSAAVQQSITSTVYVEPQNPTYDPNINNNAATDTDSVADFDITNVDSFGGSSVSRVPGNAVPGEPITYTVVVSNNSGVSATGASVVDTLPGVLMGVTYTATATGGASGFTASGTGNINDPDVSLPIGSTITYTVHATVSSAATGFISVDPTLTVPLGGDLIPTYSAPDTNVFSPAVDLEITKGDNLGGSSVTGATGTAVAGQPITYTVVVTNAGPSDTTGASVVDTLPSGLTGATYMAMATGGASGFTTSGSGSIDDADVDLPAGSTITYTVHATVASATSGTLSNTATVTPQPGTQINPYLVSGLSSVPIIAASGGDLFLLNTTVGTISEYTTAGVLVNASLITGLASPSAMVSSGGDLLIADSAAGTISEYTTAGVLVNASLVSGLSEPIGLAVSDGDLYVLNLGSGTIGKYTTDGATINASLVSGLSDETAIAVSGDDLFVTLGFATGAGFTSDGALSEYTTSGSLVNGALITDLSEPNAIVISGNDLFISNGADPFGNDNSDSIGEYTLGGAVVHAPLISTQGGGLAVSGGNLFVAEPQVDGDTVAEYSISGSSATDTDDVAAPPDLEITNIDNLSGSSVTGTPGTAVPGEGITYTISIKNAGPSDAVGAAVLDDLSNLLTGATYTATETGGASGFTASGTGSIDDSDLDIPAGATVTYTLHATIAPGATGTLSNTATVTPASESNADVVFDVIRSAAVTTTGGNSATDTDKLTPQANLNITKTDDLGGSSVSGAVGTGVPGQAITYTIVVTNTGPSDATGATVVDTLPGALSGATYTATATGGASGFVASGVGSIDNTALSLPVGSTITYTVHATIVSTATGTLSSQTTVTAPASVSNGHAGTSTAIDADKLAPNPAASQDNGLGAIDFAVSALLTGSLTVTGPYAPPPVPHTNLPISQPALTGFTIFPQSTFTPLTAAAVDNFIAVGGGGGDVELGPQLDINLTKVNQGPNPLWDTMTNSRTEEWSSDALIGNLLDKLADVDELSLVSFEFGDDVVSPATRKTQRVTAAKPVVPQGTTAAPAILRGPAGTPEFNAPAIGNGATAGQGSDGGAGTGQGGTNDTGAGQGSQGATEQAPTDSSTENATHGWGWWLGWSISAGSMGTLSWVYGWRRRGRMPRLRTLRSR